MTNYSNDRTPSAIVASLLLVFGAIAVVFGIIAIFGSWTSIDEGERGVVTRVGKIQRVYEPGFHFKVPLLDHVNKIDVRTQTVSYELEDPLYAASGDQQDVKVAAVVNYSIDPLQVEEVYKKYGSLRAFEKDVIRPTVRDTVKSAAAKFNAEELIKTRDGFTESSFKMLQNRFATSSVVVERVNITNISFSEEYTKSIEAKVTAEQKALEAQNDLARVEFEAQQRIEQAKAEAEAIRIQAQAITQQGGEDYVKLKWVEAWQTGGSQVPRFITGNGGGNFLLDVNGI